MYISDTIKYIYIVISIKYNNAPFFLFTCIVTLSPVNNRSNKGCICKRRHIKPNDKKRQSVHMAIKKTKVDERERDERNKNQTRQREALKSNEMNVEHLQL